MSKYRLIQCDDWAGLYKDGVLLQEGHSIPTRDLCEELGISYTFDEGDVDDYLMEHGSFPTKLEDVPGET